MHHITYKMDVINISTRRAHKTEEGEEERVYISQIVLNFLQNVDQDKIG